MDKVEKKKGSERMAQDRTEQCEENRVKGGRVSRKFGKSLKEGVWKQKRAKKARQCARRGWNEQRVEIVQSIEPGLEDRGR